MTDDIERWLQTGSGGAIVAAREESAESRATARNLEAYTFYTAHDATCIQCATQPTRCETGTELHQAWRETLPRRSRRP
jgi:hypothetical protein